MAKFKIGDKITFEGSGVYCIIDEVEEDFGDVRYWGLWYHEESGQYDDEGRCFIHEDEALLYGDTTPQNKTTLTVQEAIDFLISEGYTVSLTC
jgi:nitrogen fixation-related uncharacterized protein